MTFASHQDSYVVYEKESTKRIDNLIGGPDKQSFETMTAAKAARTRFIRQQEKVLGAPYPLVLEIAESDVFYTSIEKDVPYKGIAPGTGKEISGTRKANAPWCTNPLSETYWSM